MEKKSIISADQFPDATPEETRQRITMRRADFDAPPNDIPLRARCEQPSRERLNLLSRRFEKGVQGTARDSSSSPGGEKSRRSPAGKSRWNFWSAECVISQVACGGRCLSVSGLRVALTFLIDSIMTWDQVHGCQGAVFWPQQKALKSVKMWRRIEDTKNKRRDDFDALFRAVRSHLHLVSAFDDIKDGSIPCFSDSGLRGSSSLQPWGSSTGTFGSSASLSPFIPLQQQADNLSLLPHPHAHIGERETHTGTAMVEFAPPWSFNGPPSQKIHIPTITVGRNTHPIDGCVLVQRTSLRR